MENIKIGTRNSPLALWQAREVARELQNRNITTEITPISSSGDKNLDQPLYQMGITGIFTKDLDVALLNSQVDIAVHSLKDIPTQLPENLEIVTYLKRDYHQDVLVRKESSKHKPLHELKIATSSLRRRAFWLKEFPNTEFCDIRGNVQTRLSKLEEEDFDATIFSLAGLKRMKYNVEYEELPMMICAPSQGVIAVTGHQENTPLNTIMNGISDEETKICVDIERNFLRTLEGGCTAPIGAFAQFLDGEIRFEGRICSLDGQNCIEIDKIFPYSPEINHGNELAVEILQNGGREIMAAIRSAMK